MASCLSEAREDQLLAQNLQERGECARASVEGGAVRKEPRETGPFAKMREADDERVCLC